jgi:hypothetical protein
MCLDLMSLKYLETLNLEIQEQKVYLDPKQFQMKTWSYMFYIP